MKGLNLCRQKQGCFHHYLWAEGVEAVKSNGRNMDLKVRGGSFTSSCLILAHLTSLGLNFLIWKMGLWCILSKITPPVENRCSKLTYIHFFLHNFGAVIAVVTGGNKYGRWWWISGWHYGTGQRAWASQAWGALYCWAETYWSEFLSVPCHTLYLPPLKCGHACCDCQCLCLPTDSKLLQYLVLSFL